jgi:hypothetical protein
MPKYKTVSVEGHWEDDPENTSTVKVALGEWDEVEDDEDQSIFYYMDGEPLKVGDVIAEGFVVTAIDSDD